MEAIAEMLDAVLRDAGNESVHNLVRERARDLCKKFPFYSRVYAL